MSVNDELGTRMKEFYEGVPKTRLVRRMPVAIRLDGKAFHTFTRGFERPFDEVLGKSMRETMKYLCENIQGCVLGYTQSDEITLILVDYQNLNSCAWFDYEVQKMCSIAASMATMAFNKFFENNVEKENDSFTSEWLNENTDNPNYKNKKLEDLWRVHNNALKKGAMFDARCFNIPKEEVTNLIYWRQLDATRNSIQMVGQANFSHKELQKKSCNIIQEMLFAEKGINWNDYPTYLKRGSCCIKTTIQNPNVDIKDGVYPKSIWTIDLDIPIFKGDGRDYIDKRVFVGE